MRAVVSTNALELGIDIGALDVCVMAGYPGTIAATWQRAGRAGRRASRSAAVMVASSAPLDQFIVRNPSYFFDASPERALIDPDNLHILVDHVKCAAFELPFTGREQFGRHDLQQVLAILAEQGLVHRAGGSDDLDHPSDDGVWTWTNESYPADAVSLRSVSSDNFVIVDTTREPRVIGETDFTSGPATLHPEGDLHHRRPAVPGREARLRRPQSVRARDRLRLLHRRDHLHPGDDSRYASPTIVAGRTAPCRSHGEVHVVSRVVGFKKIKFYTNENVGSGELDLPEQQMHTTSYWLTVPAALMALLPFASDDRRDGIVGLSFAMRQIAQLLLMCDGHDVGISIDTEAQSPRIFIYDNYPGGIGFSEPLYRMHAELLDGTRRLISECECENGCPGCVGPIGDTGPLAKSAALRILDLLAERRGLGDSAAARGGAFEHESRRSVARGGQAARRRRGVRSPGLTGIRVRWRRRWREPAAIALSRGSRTVLGGDGARHRTDVRSSWSAAIEPGTMHGDASVGAVASRLASRDRRRRRWCWRRRLARRSSSSISKRPG